MGAVLQSQNKEVSFTSALSGLLENLATPEANEAPAPGFQFALATPVTRYLHGAAVSFEAIKFDSRLRWQVGKIYAISADLVLRDEGYGTIVLMPRAQKERFDRAFLDLGDARSLWAV